MKKAATVLSFLLASTLAFAGPTIPELFNQMKEQVKAEKWADALVTIEVLGVEADKPANAAMKTQLEGPLAFYRGVCDANLGSADKAQADFEAFLNVKPDASIDEKVYSKQAVAAVGA